MSYFISHQRLAFCWQLCLGILAIILSTGHCRSTPDTTLSLTPQRKTFDQEIGSPSELAWQAWLLIEKKHGIGPAALDSSNILRRITPKSIFIAPDLANCANGYSSDGKGVCKPDPQPVSLDEDAQRNFFLTRLKQLYSKIGSGSNTNSNNNSNKKKPVDMAGPLQINIPIQLPNKVTLPDTHSLPLHHTSHKVEQGIVEVNDRLEAIPVVISQQPSSQANSNANQESAVAVVVYQVNNDTKENKASTIEKDGPMLFLGNSSTSAPKKDPLSVSQVVPVADFVDDMNETFTGVVDYKIPINLKSVFNKSNDQKMTTSSDIRQSEKKTDSSENSSPTVVLLLSPTKFPTTERTTQKETVAFKVTDYDRRETEQIESTTDQVTEEETKSEQFSTIQTVAPLGLQTAANPIDSTSRTTEKSFTQYRPEDEVAYTDGDENPTEQDSEEQEEIEYDDETTEPDDFSESEDELLKPGEAGMMMSQKNQDIMRTKNHQKQSTIADTDDLTSTTFTDSTTLPTFPTVDMLDRDRTDPLDASDSTIKTESTDFTREDTMTTQTTEVPSTIVITTTEPAVEETTIYTTRPWRFKSSLKTTIVTSPPPTQPPVLSTIKIKEGVTDSKDIFETERDLVTEPEVIFSTQGSHSMTTTYGHRKPAYPSRITGLPYTLGEFDEVISRTEIPPLTDYPQRNPTDFRRQKPTITINNEPILFKNDGNIPSEFKDQMAESSKPSSTDFRQIYSNNQPSTYVRFPDQTSETRPPLQSQSYVRFPSDEMNSIHNQDTYKDHLLLPYRLREEFNSNSATSTKSSVPVRQKPPVSHWRVPPPGIRMDRQQQQQQQLQQQIANNQRQQKQKPMLLRFWARMPLVRDLTFYPTTSHGSHNEPIGGQQEENNRRINSRFSSLTSSASPRRVNYYKEMSSHDVNRLLAHQLGQPAIGG